MFYRIACVCVGLGIIAVLYVLLLPPPGTSTKDVWRRSKCSNNLKQIGLALLNYHDVYQAFPPAYTVDADGRRLHSWRTLLLPWLDQKPLYDTIDLSKPWDDPANANAFHAELSIFRCPEADCPENHATYLAIVASDGCMRPGASAKISEITDGLSNTLVVIEAPSAHAVHWMAPMDASESLVTGFGPATKPHHKGGQFVAFVDGHVRFIKDQVTAAQWRALISIAGKEPFPAGQW